MVVVMAKSIVDTIHMPIKIHLSVVHPEARFASLSVNAGDVSTIRMRRMFSTTLKKAENTAEKTDDRNSR